MEPPLKISVARSIRIDPFLPRSLYQKQGHARLDASIVALGKEYSPLERFMNNRAALTSTWAKSIDDERPCRRFLPPPPPQEAANENLRMGIYTWRPRDIYRPVDLSTRALIYFTPTSFRFTHHPPSAPLLSAIPKSQQTAGATPRVCTGFREFQGGGRILPRLQR